MEPKHKVIFEDYTSEDIYNIFLYLQGRFESGESEILKLMPDIDREKDSRYLVFSLSKRSLQCYILSSSFLKDSLSKMVWWKNQNFFDKEITTENLIDILENYQEEMKMGFLNSIFIHLEIYVRTIASNLPNNSSKKQSDRLSDIINNLTMREAINADFGKLIAIIRNIRNAFHFGGFHTSRPEQISYKGLNYNFERDKPIALGGWNDLKFLISELIEFYLFVSKSKVVKNISFIEHPHSTIEPVEI